MTRSSGGRSGCRPRLLVLALVLLTAGCGGSPPVQPADVTTLAAAQTAVVQASAVEARVSTIAQAAATAGARADMAVGTAVALAQAVATSSARAEAAAATAIVAAQQPTMPARPAPAAEIPVDGGVAIAYLSNGSSNLAFYTISRMVVYKDYQEFEDQWVDSNAQVGLALIETEEGSNEWQLIHTEEPSTTSATPTGWSEYTLLAALGRAEATQALTGTTGLVYEQEPEQKIVTSTLLVSGPIPVARLSTQQNRALISRLLLISESQGVRQNTLVIMDDDNGGGGDRKQRLCRRSARYRAWNCRR
jgi:hypothetical protein